MFMFLFLFFSMLLRYSFFRLKELFQVEMIELSRYFSFSFFLKLPKIWVGRTALKGEKKGDGLIMSGVFSDNFVLESV